MDGCGSPSSEQTELDYVLVESQLVGKMTKLRNRELVTKLKINVLSSQRKNGCVMSSLIVLSLFFFTLYNV